MRTHPARSSSLFLLLVSGGLFAGAFGFQYIGGLPPCEMCYWQRYAHLVVLVIGLAAFGLSSRPLAWLQIVAMLGSAGLGLFHAGVEQRWWEGVTACASTATQAGMTTEEMLSALIAAPLVRCDQIPWAFLSLSMAAWNALISALAALVAIWLLKRRATR